jgi:hypothetical protein
MQPTQLQRRLHKLNGGGDGVVGDGAGAGKGIQYQRLNMRAGGANRRPICLDPFAC